jgi:hypothetical protein
MNGLNPQMKVIIAWMVAFFAWLKAVYTTKNALILIGKTHPRVVLDPSTSNANE